jgi:hypothetical protein
VRVPPINVNKDWADYLYILASLLLTLATFTIAIYAVSDALTCSGIKEYGPPNRWGGLYLGVTEV